jgi:hypothetical protein
MPPYGSKEGGARVIQPVADYIEQESQNQPRKHNLRPRARGAARDRDRPRDTRRQGYMKRKVAELMAKKLELTVVRDALRHDQIVKAALAQADDALESVNVTSKFVKGFHSDHSFFDVWEKAIQLCKEAKTQPVTMKGLK